MRQRAYVEILSTREVWRALKRLELHSAAPRATLTPLSCSPNFPSAQYLDIRTLTHELIVKHSCNVKMFCCARANQASTNLKKVLRWKLGWFVLFTYFLVDWTLGIGIWVVLHVNLNWASSFFCFLHDLHLQSISFSKTSTQETRRVRVQAFRATNSWIIWMDLNRWYSRQLLQCDYYNRGHLDKVGQLDYRKITIHSEDVSCPSLEYFKQVIY